MTIAITEICCTAEKTPTKQIKKQQNAGATAYRYEMK